MGDSYSPPCGWWWWGRSGGSGGFSVVRRGGEGGGRAREEGNVRRGRGRARGYRRTYQSTWDCCSARRSRYRSMEVFTLDLSAAPMRLPTVPSVAIAPEERTEERPRPGEVLFRLDATPRWFVRTRRGERGAREARVAARYEPTVASLATLKYFTRRGRAHATARDIIDERSKRPGRGKDRAPVYGRPNTSARARRRGPRHATESSRAQFRSLAAFDRSDRVSSSLARASRVRAQRSTRDGRISRATRWRTSPSRCHPWQITSPSRTRTCRSRRTMARYAHDARRGPRRDIDPRAPPPPLAPARSLPNLERAGD